MPLDDTLSTQTLGGLKTWAQQLEDALDRLGRPANNSPTLLEIVLSQGALLSSLRALVFTWPRSREFLDTFREQWHHLLDSLEWGRLGSVSQRRPWQQQPRQPIHLCWTTVLLAILPLSVCPRPNQREARLLEVLRVLGEVPAVRLPAALTDGEDGDQKRTLRNLGRFLALSGRPAERAGWPSGMRSSQSEAQSAFAREGRPQEEPFAAFFARQARIDAAVLCRAQAIQAPGCCTHEALATPSWPVSLHPEAAPRYAATQVRPLCYDFAVTFRQQTRRH